MHGSLHQYAHSIPAQRDFQLENYFGCCFLSVASDVSNIIFIVIIDKQWHAIDVMWDHTRRYVTIVIAIHRTTGNIHLPWKLQGNQLTTPRVIKDRIICQRWARRAILKRMSLRLHVATTVVTVRS
jgi:hypothetical protein